MITLEHHAMEVKWGRAIQVINPPPLTAKTSKTPSHLRFETRVKWAYLHLATIFANYNQQVATFLDSFIYFYRRSTCFRHSGSSSAHHQEHIIVRTVSGIVNRYCCLLLPWMRRNSNSIGWQYLKLYVQLCAPDDGRGNRMKHVERL